MRKILLLLATTVAVALWGCSENKNDDQNNALAGTTWRYVYVDDNFSDEESLQFVSASSCIYTMVQKENGIVITDIRATGTYSYNPPVVEIHMEYEGQKATIKAIVETGEYTFIKED